MKNRLIAQNQKPQGINGGTVIAGKNKIEFNNIIENNIEGASLFNNEFKLHKGKYNISAKIPLHDVGMRKHQIYDIASDEVLLEQLNEDSISGIIAIEKDNTWIGIRSLCEKTKLRSGLGKALDIEDNIEVYSEIVIEKINKDVR